ncbi:MAG: hypothetical protein WCA10_13925 [Terracidiphilus sp.]
MNTDRRAILSLVAMGRITAAEAERLLAAWNESRETAWIVGLCLAFACLAQLNLHELLILMHFCSAQIPALAEAVHRALSPITGPVTDLMSLARGGGLL